MADMKKNVLNGNMKLTLIQSEMKAPKTEYNSFNKFAYRTTGEIQYFLKPLCVKYRTRVVPTTECIWLGSEAHGAFFQKATVDMVDDDSGELIATSTAMAQQDTDKKGMSAPQVSASAAQYAVKRALEQLLMLDDSAPEVDSLPPEQVQRPTQPVPRPVQRPAQPRQMQPQRAAQQQPAQPVQASQKAPQRPAQAQPVQVSQPQVNTSQKPVQAPQKAASQAPAGPRAGWAQQLKEYDAQQKAAQADPWAANMKDSK